MADTDRVAINRANKAKLLLEDEEFKNAIAAVKTSIFERIEACPVRDIEGLHTLRLELKILNDVVLNIKHVMNTGKIVEHRISVLEKMKRMVR